MNHIQQNSLLNDVLVNLHRSLLQYMGECSPWVPVDESEKMEQVKELIRFQHSAVIQIEELLEFRRTPVDFGLYPVEYTDLQFLSLSYLLKESLLDAKADEKIILQAIEDSFDDVDAKSRLNQALEIQQEVIANLELLISKPKTSPQQTTS
ncbi:hypothetical protein MNBD_PLANCTO02-2296 [hydrothermal vent metagenome]|uniref:Uncharacterized protein n=1 Tax=hydrothermal vent metagenome TaxID=652676 RepID=A0A3B1E313_9ZZZZ